jgi:hypothetical protein
MGLSNCATNKYYSNECLWYEYIFIDDEYITKEIIFNNAMFREHCR